MARKIEASCDPVSVSRNQVPVKKFRCRRFYQSTIAQPNYPLVCVVVQFAGCAESWRSMLGLFKQSEIAKFDWGAKPVFRIGVAVTIDCCDKPFRNPLCSIVYEIACVWKRFIVSPVSASCERSSGFASPGNNRNSPFDCGTFIKIENYRRVGVRYYNWRDTIVGAFNSCLSSAFFRYGSCANTEKVREIGGRAALRCQCDTDLNLLEKSGQDAGVFFSPLGCFYTDANEAEPCFEATDFYLSNDQLDVQNSFAFEVADKRPVKRCEDQSRFSKRWASHIIDEERQFFAAVIRSHNQSIFSFNLHRSMRARALGRKVREIVARRRAFALCSVIAIQLKI